MKEKTRLLEYSDAGRRQKQSGLSLSAMLLTIQQRAAAYNEKSTNTGVQCACQDRFLKECQACES